MAIKVPPEEQGRGRGCCIGIIFLAFVLALMASIVVVRIFANKKPQYYAAIDAVSGLDPATNLGKPAIDKVEFQLTIGVKSRSPFSSECLEPGASVEVTYIGVQIASGSTGARACAVRWQPEQMVRMPIVARGTGAQLPGSVLDSLAADERQGVAVLDILLRIPSTRGEDAKLVVCRGRFLGGASKAMSAPCDVL